MANDERPKDLVYDPKTGTYHRKGVKSPKHRLTKEEEKALEELSRKKGGRAALLERARLEGREEEFLAEEEAFERSERKKKAKEKAKRQAAEEAPVTPLTPAGAAPRIPRRTEPYSGAQFGGYLPIPHPQWGGLGGYAPPGATPEMLAPYQERISATTEMARNRLADIIRRWEDFKAAQSWRGPAAPAPWGGTAMPGAMPPTAMPQAPVAQNPIELLRQRQLQAQQGLQQQALAGQQARQAAGSQLANMRWNPQEMQQFGQQMPGTRTFPGQIFPEAPQLNLFPGGSYQGSVTSPWEGW